MSNALSAALSRFRTGFARDNKRIEHEVAERSGVEKKIDRPGHVTIRAQNLFDVAAVSAQEKFDLHRVGGDDGVVVRFEGRLHDGRHSLEADGVRLSADVAAFL